MTPSSDSPRRAASRRLILGWSGAGLAAAIAGILGWRRAQDFILGTPPRQAAAPAPERPADKLPRPPAHNVISREAFVPYLETEFALESGALSTTPIKLVDVSPATTLRSKTAEFTAFSLLFAAPKKFAVESKVYRLVQPQMGAMDLFLSPVGGSKEHVHLEAAVSQRV